ncbi:MAG TPA: hypothetical protein VMW27_04080 [Thermoanaerobaculia bacterium]|nr:hypothetical protein [Thermoanaerobaculia bacterium]
MSLKLSVEEMLAHLEQRVVSLREQEVLHAQQEVYHREQRALVAAELEKVAQSLESFRVVAVAAADLVGPVEIPADEELPPRDRLMVGRLIQLAVDSPGLQEPFDSVALAAEANRRFADQLDKPIGSRAASDVLRRMLALGKVRLVRKGKGSLQALYTRSSARGAAK